MEIRDATMEEFDIAFDYIEKLWTSNDYDKETIRKVYQEVLENEEDFAFFLYDEGDVKGFCHGTYFNTFWHSGKSCYVSSIITNEEIGRASCREGGESTGRARTVLKR